VLRGGVRACDHDQLQESGSENMGSGSIGSCKLSSSAHLCAPALLRCERCRFGSSLGVSPWLAHVLARVAQDVNVFEEQQ
jgi:hypothetical protein